MKRSRIYKEMGTMIRDCDNWKPDSGVLQWAYSGSQAMLRAPNPNKNLPVLSVLRTVGPSNQARKQVVGWIEEWMKETGTKGLVDGFIGFGGPGVIWMAKEYDKYFATLQSAQIIVT